MIPVHLVKWSPTKINDIVNGFFDLFLPSPAVDGLKAKFHGERKEFGTSELK